MGKRPSSYDPATFTGTRGPAKSFPQAESDAARKRAAGAEPPPYDPAFHAQVGREIVDRAKRTVMGLYETKGRSPMHVLTPHQFANFQSTGAWEGMPTPEQYGRHSAVPEDKEYEKLT